jgi:hypothetical protein
MRHEKKKEFRVKESIRSKWRARKRRLAKRLDKDNYPDDLSQPMMRAGNVQYELSSRSVGTACGGIGLIHQLARELKLAEEINRRVALFKFPLPYHESDHVLNLAYNALCGGRCLEDLELRRQDEAYLNLLGAERIPDPTTAGDFCRRFEPYHLLQLQLAFDAVRKVEQRTPNRSRDQPPLCSDCSETVRCPGKNSIRWNSWRVKSRLPRLALHNSN